MLTKPFKKENLNISMLGLGCMRFPKARPDSEDIDYEEAQKIVDYAHEHGVTYYDTAYMYHGGGSEKFMGHALKKYPRESFQLATKMPIWMADSKEDVPRIFEEQLARLQTDYFDFYLFHSLNRAHFERCREFGLYEYLMKKKEQGVIRHIGFSFHDTPDVLEDICGAYSWDFAQIQLNYLDWDMQDAKGQYEILTRHGLPCIVMEPVRGGTLASPCKQADDIFKAARPGKSVASWAIRFAASLPNVMTVLSGMSSLTQLKDNIATLSDFEPVTQADLKTIRRAVEAYQCKDTVPCTGCRYCMDCPAGVDIPAMFRIYNEYTVSLDRDACEAALNALPKEQLLTRCVDCKQCQTHCPQAIEIPEQLRRVGQILKLS